MLDGFSWSGSSRRDEAALAELAKGAGPGMTDLDLKNKQETAAVSQPQAEASQPQEEKKSGGLLGGLRRLVGGKEKEAPAAPAVLPVVPQPAAPKVEPPAGSTRAEAEARYSKILAKFLSDLAADSAAQAFAKTNKVSFQFVLKYSAITFYMGFGDGKVSAGVGEAPLTAPHPAILNAIYDACGVRITKLPAYPEKVLAGLQGKK